MAMFSSIAFFSSRLSRTRVFLNSSSESRSFK
jgi:hypothetical protein